MPARSLRNLRSSRVSIQVSASALLLFALCDWWRAGLCACRDGWHPGISGEGVADGGDDVARRACAAVSRCSRGWRTGCGWRSRSGAGRRSSAGSSRAAGRVRPGWRWAGSAGRVRKRSTSASRSRRHSSSMPAGFLLRVRAGHAGGPPTGRRGRRCGTAAGQRRWRRPGRRRGPCPRAVFAAWIRARSASAAWPGQIASGYAWAASSRSRRMCGVQSWCSTPGMAS